MPNFVPPAHNSASPFADMRGHHVAVRTPDLESAKRWYVETLDFRVVAEWDYGDQKLAYIVPPTDDHFYVEIFGGGDPRDVRPYSDLADSLTYAGYHHFCLAVSSVDETVKQLRARGVTIVTEPFVLPAISRRLAIVSDPFGNLIEICGSARLTVNGETNAADLIASPRRHRRRRSQSRRHRRGRDCRGC